MIYNECMNRKSRYIPRLGMLGLAFVICFLSSCGKPQELTQDFIIQFTKDFAAVGYKEHDPELPEKYQDYMTDAALAKLQKRIDNQWEFTNSNTAGNFEMIEPIVDSVVIFPEESNKQGDQRILCEGTFNSKFDPNPVYFRICIIQNNGKITSWEDEYYGTTKPYSPNYSF